MLQHVCQNMTSLDHFIYVCRIIGGVRMWINLLEGLESEKYEYESGQRWIMVQRA